MITIGVDAHKGVPMAVAVDVAGQEVARWRGPNSAAGWRELAAWAGALGTAHRWGSEGAWNYGRGLAQHLVEVGAEVYEVNPRWTAAARRAARRRDKSDRLDARAVALLVAREAATVPVVAAEDDTVVLERLVTERAGALAEATRLGNQLHQLLLQLDPEYKRHLPALTSQAGLRAAEGYTVTGASPVPHQRAGAVRRLAHRPRLALAQAKELAAQIGAIAAARFAPLTAICGVGVLTAGALAGILGPGRRFASDAQLAAYAGVAPLEASSAERVRHRLNRTGNRRLNAILFRIALTQARRSPQARAYRARRTSEGQTKRAAVRALKRFLARAIWRQWQRCLRAPAPDMDAV